MIQREKALARLLRDKLEGEGWYVKKLHGSKYQSGLPDLLCIHKLHGIAFIETKAPGGFLSLSQQLEFSRMSDKGAKIYVMEDWRDYYRIFGQPNWTDYIRHNKSLW